MALPTSTWQGLCCGCIYTFPDDGTLHGPVAVARNGWQLGGIYKQSTGTPFTPLIGGDPLGKGGTDPWDYPDRITSCDMVNHNFKQNGLAYVNFACFPVPGRNATPNPVPARKHEPQCH